MCLIEFNDVQCVLMINALRLLLKQDSEFYYFDEDYFAEEFKLIKSLIKKIEDCYLQGEKDES